MRRYSRWLKVLGIILAGIIHTPQWESILDQVSSSAVFGWRCCVHCQVETPFLLSLSLSPVDSQWASLCIGSPFSATCHPVPLFQDGTPPAPQHTFLTGTTWTCLPQWKEKRTP